MKRNRKEQERYLTIKGHKRHKKVIRSKKRRVGLVNFRYTPDLEYNDILKHIYFSQKKESSFFRNQDYYTTTKSNFYLPKVFSLTENPKESFRFINEMTKAFFRGDTKRIIFDYSNCEHIDLDAQIYMDIILMYIIEHYKRCRIYGKKSNVKSIDAINLKNKELQKILLSVGSHAIVKKLKISFSDVIAYRLCIGKRDSNNIGQKEVDITNLIDYVIDSLGRVNKQLAGKRITDLSQVVGEVLANAEEHSSLNSRFSIGYYKDVNENNKHYGLLNLVILNFGQTIYEKFKDPECPHKAVVKQMRDLSKHYTKRKFFSKNRFEEETLWTLYALQEGVTSTLKRRGNGSIRFIEGFFNLSANDFDDKRMSKLTIFSGNTEIVFDGTYKIEEKLQNSSKFKVMTFNESGDIRDKPDKKVVRYTDNYFPGTMISIKIVLTEEDLINHE